MAWKCRIIATHLRRPALSRALAQLCAVALVSLGIACGGSEVVGVGQTKITSIVIDNGDLTVERGSKVTYTATVLDSLGKKTTIPVVWRSTVDSIGMFGPNGALATRDTGVAFITASALGVTSNRVYLHVVWNGAYEIAPFRFAPPNAISPGLTPGDSIRVQVTNRIGGPAAGSLVSFGVTGGGGTVSPRLVTANQAGIAAAAWTLGSAAGKNSLTASVVAPDDSTTVVPWVKNNPATFTVTSFQPLLVVQGDNQTGSVLAPLTVAPSVRLVDTLGKPRPGIPVTFAPTGNGRVSTTVVSTNVDGVASPGVWTLGDLQGDEQLVVTVESGKLVLHATATGSTVRFAAVQVATAQYSTCALTSDQLVSCLGQWPQVGTGDSVVNRSIPTLTKGNVHFTSIAGGSARFCGITNELSIYCWGISPLIDTTTATVSRPGNASTGTPTRLPSNIAWLQVSIGGQHTCALANDKTAYCWGVDANGQLGDNGSDTRFQPAPVVGGFKFNMLAGGASHECGINLNNDAFCWGLNNAGQLGDGTTTTRRTPTAVAGTVKFSTIGAGQATTCGLNLTGVAYCWGANTTNRVPAPYSSTTPTFASLSVGASHACALTNDGTAYCWGDNSSGQLGDSTTTSRSEPTPVTTTIRFKTISAGFQHTCGISTDGFLACWGRNEFGELGVSTPLVQTTPRFIVLEVKP